jgi:hypothetical protein
MNTRLLQGDYKPAIRISKSDFILFAKNEYRLEKKDFVNRMREQLEFYIQSRLSSTSEFWCDTLYDYNTIGPLKYLLVETFKMRQQMQQLLTSDTVRRVPSADAINSEISEKAKSSAVAIRDIGQVLRQLASEGQAGGLTDQITDISTRLQELGAALEEQSKVLERTRPGLATAPASTSNLQSSLPGSPSRIDQRNSSGERSGSVSPLFRNGSALQPQSFPFITLQPIPEAKEEAGPGVPLADQKNTGPSPALDEAEFRVEFPGIAAMVPPLQLPQQHAATGRARSALPQGSPSNSPLPMQHAVQQRLFRSEDGRGRQGYAGAGSCEVSLTCEGRPSDVVLVGGVLGRNQLL